MRILESDHLRPIYSPETFLWGPGNKLLSVFTILHLSYKAVQNFPSPLGLQLCYLCVCVCVVYVPAYAEKKELRKTGKDVFT